VRPPAQPGLAILISGRGSNLQAFIDACASGALAAQISVVISNNPAAGCNARSVPASPPVSIIARKQHA
jgi:folate-dependent phosphoribosylglycinamide formyltransferase PurN